MKARIWVSVVAAALTGMSALSACAQDLYVVPARYSVLQVMFDVVKMRPAGLVSYQGNATTQVPALHAWNGQEWVRIGIDSLRDGSFAAVKPARVVLVGDKDTLPPVLADAVQSLAPVILSWSEMDNASLVNGAGKLQKFTSREWAWFAGRYNMQIQDSNDGRRKDSWYYRDHPELRGGAPVLRKSPEWSAPDAVPPAQPAPVQPVPPTPAPAVPATKAPVEPAAAFSPNAMWEQPAPPATEAPAAATKTQRGIK